MPLPEIKISETGTIISFFCFKRGGRIERYALIKETKDRIFYYLCLLQNIDGKFRFTGKNYLVNEKEVPFLINLYDDEGDHQEEEYKFPALELVYKNGTQKRNRKEFNGVFKYAPLKEDCSFKPFILGHPPPSDNAVSSLLEFAAGRGNMHNEENRGRNRKRKTRNESRRKVRKSRKNKS